MRSRQLVNVWECSGQPLDSRPWSAIIVPYMSTTTLIAESLFGRIRRELLCILLLNPERSFFLLELVALLRTGRGGVQRELANLTASGLAVREREGSRTYYRAHADAPVLPELTALLRTSVDAGGSLDRFLETLAGEVSFAVRSPASVDSSGRFVIELLVEGTVSSEDLRGGLELVELLNGSTVREVRVEPGELFAYLLGSGGVSWLDPSSCAPLIGEWPEEVSGEASVDPNDATPDLFSTIGTDWRR